VAEDADEKGDEEAKQSENESGEDKSLGRQVKNDRLTIKINECLATFYELMNKKAVALNMGKSNFAVAHGMHNDNNYSSAYDIGKLCCFAMDNQDFRDIVIQQNRECRSQKFPGHVYKWENTNNLLKEGFDGIKTGITPTAGPCLAASI
jgi:D-alanyl-D-alanine carboxypeptidase